MASGWCLSYRFANSIDKWGGGLCTTHECFTLESKSETKFLFWVLSFSCSLCLTNWEIKLDLDPNLSNNGCLSLLHQIIFQCLRKNKKMSQDVKLSKTIRVVLTGEH